MILKELRKFLHYLYHEDHTELARQYREGAMGKSSGFEWYTPIDTTRLDRFAAMAKSADLSLEFFKPVTLRARIRRMFIH
jgi:hypothetical protein